MFSNLVLSNKQTIESYFLCFSRYRVLFLMLTEVIIKRYYIYITYLVLDGNYSKMYILQKNKVHLAYAFISIAITRKFNKETSQKGFFFFFISNVRYLKSKTKSYCSSEPTVDEVVQFKIVQFKIVSCYSLGFRENSNR